MRRSSSPKPNLKRLVPELVAQLVTWFHGHARDLPWRTTLDPYALWIAEVMLQQTQVKAVIPFWVRWMQALPNVSSLADAPSEQLLKLWEGLGYYTRARHLQRAAQRIMTEHAGQFPRAFDDILALPGIGRYTAGAIASTAFNEPRPILDGNVLRVLTRLFGITHNARERSTTDQLWSLATALVEHAAFLPARAARLRHSHLRMSGPCSVLNQSLMELGATVCLPRQPRCAECPVQHRCLAQRTGRTGAIPNLGPRPGSTARRFMAFLVECDGQWLVRQRPAGGVNAHLWEFPNLEVDAHESDPGSASRRLFPAVPGAFDLVEIVRHSITRYRIALEAYRARCDKAWRTRTLPRADMAGKWLAPEALDQLPFTAAHRRLLKHLHPAPLAGDRR